MNTSLTPVLDSSARAADHPVDNPELRPQLAALIQACGADPRSRPGQLIQDLLHTSLKLASDPTGLGERKLLTRSFKELRHAFRVFAGYSDTPKVSIFGSARTPADHPDYRTAVEFSKLMGQRGWLVITGAGDGIMKAGHEGPGADGSFGLSIRLPFETTANTIIAGDKKLLHFNYFFTRKLMFLSQCNAVVAFPGGFGTQDELLEALTLIQTGKSQIVPIVLLAGEGSQYWNHWHRYVSSELLGRGFISEPDTDLYYLASDPTDALAHISDFYRNYHSSRYVGNELVIRVQRPITETQLRLLNDEFGMIVKYGSISQTAALPQEGEHLALPRLTFTHTRSSFAKVRQLIDRVNQFDLENATAPVG